MFTTTRHCPQVILQLNLPLHTHKLKDGLEKDIRHRKRVITQNFSNVLGILEVGKIQTEVLCLPQYLLVCEFWPERNRCSAGGYVRNFSFL